jgi:predicted transcriptional regulator
MPPRLSGRQLDVMQVLWDRGEATVADVQQALGAQSPLAYTTVSTLLTRLEKKGLVKHRCEGRTFYYKHAVSRGKLGRSMAVDVIERVFGGSPTLLVSHLLESDQVDAEELARLKQLIEQHESQQQGGSKARRREEKP